MQIYMISYFSSLEFAQVKLNYSFVVVLYLFPRILWLRMLTMIFCTSDEDRYDENWELGEWLVVKFPNPFQLLSIRGDAWGLVN